MAIGGGEALLVIEAGLRRVEVGLSLVEGSLVLRDRLVGLDPRRGRRVELLLRGRLLHVGLIPGLSRPERVLCSLLLLELVRRGLLGFIELGFCCVALASLDCRIPELPTADPPLRLEVDRPKWARMREVAEWAGAIRDHRAVECEPRFVRVRPFEP